MTLLPKPELVRLLDSPGFEIERTRREFLIDFMESLTRDELAQMVRCEETPAEEVAFIRACVGLPPLEAATLRPLQPSETLR